MAITYKTSEGRGHWVNNNGWYSMECFECPTEEKTYGIGTSKEDGRWMIEADDHSIFDMIGLGMPENGFKTLKEAKAFAEDFAEDFERCYDENHPEIELTDFVVVNAWDEAVKFINNGSTFIKTSVANASVMTLDQALKMRDELGEDWAYMAV